MADATTKKEPEKKPDVLGAVMPSGEALDAISKEYARAFLAFAGQFQGAVSQIKVADQIATIVQPDYESIRALWIDFQTNLRTEFIGRKNLEVEAMRKEARAAEPATTAQLNYIRDMAERGGRPATVLAEFMKTHATLEGITKEMATELITKMKSQ